MTLPEAFHDEDYTEASQREPRAREREFVQRNQFVAHASRAAPLAFAAVTFLGAFLLFLVQPLVAKFILPRFGGGPAVWTTCVLYFQAILLVGYAYAHLGSRGLSPRALATVHVALLALAIPAAFVLTRAPNWQPRSGTGASEVAPIAQILALLTVTVSLPCLVLSATSPLIHAWFARVAPASGAGVYRLYAVSNAGSLLALLAYPFLIEPVMTRRAQALLWAAGVALFAIACAYCAWLSARPVFDTPHDRRTTPGAAEPAYRASAIERFLWLALPACASVMLLATTNTMTHDVAAMPLLWVVPLVLYLLTFVLAFDAPRWYRRPVAALTLPLAAAGVCAVLLGADTWLSTSGRAALLAAAMFACCLACHGELAALKPPPHRLTAYYLTIAAGGAGGGALVAVAAPLALDRYAELHLGLWATCALVLAAPHLTRRGAAGPRPSALLAMLGVAGLVVLAAVLWEARDPYPFAGGKPVHRWRDFYGVVTLYEAHRDDPERESLLIRHAGVTHGLQFRSDGKRKQPTAYFGETSGVGLALRAPGPPRRVGVVGLGAGTLAAYGRPGDSFRFYELSPTVERVARDHFTFLADSAARCDVVVGDGRLSLEREPPQGFDVLVLDAFSGHAIPVHLLTAEAFATYRRHLAPGAVVCVNVSNRYVDIQPVVARHAEAQGWTALLVSTPNGNDSDGLLEADWVLLTPDRERAEPFRRAGGAAPRSDPNLRRWTDDYASLFPVLR